jgi:hypothetical protein
MILAPGIALGLVLNVLPVSWDIGNDLWRECHGTPAQEAFCRGFIAGIANALEAGPIQDIGNRICLPPGGLTPEQMEAIVMQFIQTHWDSDTLESNAIVSIAIALGRQFPCR